MVRCIGQQPGPRCGAISARQRPHRAQMTLQHAHGRQSSHGHHSVRLQVRVRPRCALVMVCSTRGWRCYLSLQRFFLCLNGVQKPHACLASRSLTQVSVCAAHGQVEKNRCRIRPRRARGYIVACGLSFDDMFFIFGSRLATLVAFIVFLSCTGFSFRFHNFP